MIFLFEIKILMDSSLVLRQMERSIVLQNEMSIDMLMKWLKK
jgi:hypothetical protein